MAEPPQAQAAVAAMATGKRAEVKFQEIETQTPNSLSVNSNPPPNSQNKTPRCALSAVFGLCIGTRTS